MKKNGLLIIFAVWFLACGKDPEDTPSGLPDTPFPVDTLFWEMPHARFLGLYGQVRRCVESGMEDEMAVVSETMEFDSCGHLTWYDPAGLSALPVFAGSVVPFDMGWMDPSTYRYAYNPAGQMITATVETLGSEPVVYRLEYGKHSCFIPLPFQFGRLPFFLIKGLVRVEAPRFSYVFDGTSAMVSTTSWNGTTTIAYRFNGDYPNRREEIVVRGTDTVSRAVTTYTFLEDGVLSFSSRVLSTPGESDEERMDITYKTGFLLLPETEILRYNNEEAGRNNYVYDLAGNVTAKTSTLGEDGETNTYSEPDVAGNWTKKVCRIPGMGTLDYRRETGYYGENKKTE